MLFTYHTEALDIILKSFFPLKEQMPLLINTDKNIKYFKAEILGFLFKKDYL